MIVKDDPFQIMVWVTSWLRGDAITLDGVVYIFPHGAREIRKLIQSLGVTGLDEVTGFVPPARRTIRM